MKNRFFVLVIISAVMLFCTIFCLGQFSPSKNLAFAENDGKFLRVIDSETPLYKEENKNEILFFLPYSYYVKVISEENEFLYVECSSSSLPALYGYVEKDKLFYDGLDVSNPYPNIKITTINTSVIYADSSLNSPLLYVFKDRKLTYYGSYKTPNGEYIYYVGFNDKLGYIKEGDILPFTVGVHPNKLTFIKQSDTISPTSATTTFDTSFFLKIAVIFCLLVAGVIALFISIKHKPRPTDNDDSF